MYEVTLTASPNASVTVQDPKPTDGRFSETLAPSEVRVVEMTDSQFDNMKPILDRLVTAGLLTYDYHDGSASEFVNDSTVDGERVSDALNNLKASSGAVMFGWTYKTPTADSDPGVGNFRLNNADPSLATFIYISVTTGDGVDVSSVLSELRDKVDVAIDPPNPINGLILYECSGASVDAVTYYKIPVTFQDQGPDPIPADTLCEISFISAFAHAIGGDLHEVSTIEQFNTKLSNGNVDDESNPRPSLELPVMGEPTGFPNRTNSTYSFSDSTPDRQFTIEPTGAEFDYYIHGTKYTKDAPENIVIDDVEGLVFIYYDGDTLAKTTTFTEALILDRALVALIYWDATNKTALMLADERHGINMPGMTHYYLHATRGTAWDSGLDITDLDVDQSGDLDVHAQLGFTSGVIFDEDLRFTIAAGTAPAQIPVFYKVGASGNWRKYTATDYPVRSFNGLGTNRLSYNQYTGGAWQETEVTNNNFVLCHLFATNDDTNKVIAVQGENEYGNIAAARTGAEAELRLLSYGGLPIAEFTPIATIIYQTSNSYGNAVQARTRSTGDGADYIDWRGSQGASSGTISLPSTDYLLRAANDFTEFPQKSTPVNDDLLLLEDSAAGNAKKYATRAAVAGVFGQDYQRVESLTESQTTLASYQDKVSLVTPALTGTYRVNWGAMVNHNNKAGRVQLYNSTDTVVVGSEVTHRQKTENYLPYGGAHEVTFTGASKTFTIQWRDEAGGETQSIKDAWIEIWRVS